jgi:hypothetical protein
MLAGALVLVTAGCGVRDRQVLIGHYVVPGTGEAWTLEEDGTCRIERGGATLPCEWVYQEDEDGARLVVTVNRAGAAPSTLRYVLTPSKWLGQPLTIPLSASATLEKRG